MDDAEVRERAGAIARQLRLPWSPDRVSVRRRRLWPFPAFWFVESRVADVRAVVTIRLNDRTGDYTYAGARYLTPDQFSALRPE